MKEHIAFCLALIKSAAVVALAQAPGSADYDFHIAESSELRWRPQGVQPDGHILLTRDVHDFRVPLRLVLARIDRQGRYDPAFSPAQVTCQRVPEAIADRPVAATQPDGNILVAMLLGHLILPGEEPVVLVRLSPNGELDRSFLPVPEERLRGGFAREIYVLPDGKILLGLLRLNSNGAIDETFRPPDPEMQRSERMVLQTDGKLLVWYTADDGRTQVSRVNPDGTRDPSFRGVVEEESYPALSSGWKEISIHSKLTQRDGRIVLGGSFLRENDRKLLWLIRLNADGTLDKTFQSPRDGEEPLQYHTDDIERAGVLTMLLEPDGNMLVTLLYYLRESPEAPAALPQLETLRFRGDGLPYMSPYTLRRGPDATISFEMTAATNNTVVVEASTNLSNGTWAPIVKFPPGPDRGVMKVLDSSAGQSPRRFYRAVTE